MHELLGSHKASQEWYTPDHILDRVYLTIGDYYDPCPIMGANVGLTSDWTAHNALYVNPPTPAAPWALKALQTIQENPDTHIIFAAFSEAVLWQVNDLMDYPVCWVRNRIRWIDGNKIVRGDSNPNYLREAKSPRNYNCFVLLSNSPLVRYRFLENFQELGTIRTSEAVSLQLTASR